MTITKNKIAAIKASKVISAERLYHADYDEKERLVQLNGIKISVEKYQYYVVKSTYEKEIIVELYPVVKKSDVASSEVKFSDYAYTNSGSVFRKAVEIAKELAEMLN
jgi:hypothetical protein